MPFFDRLKAAHSVEATEDEPHQDGKEETLETSVSAIGSDSETVSQDAQAGVQKMEATTQVWTRQHLIIAYVMFVQLPTTNGAQPR